MSGLVERISIPPSVRITIIIIDSIWFRTCLTDVFVSVDACYIVQGIDDGLRDRLEALAGPVWNMSRCEAELVSSRQHLAITVG